MFVQTYCYSSRVSRIEKIPGALFKTFLASLDKTRGSLIREMSNKVEQHIESLVYRDNIDWKFTFEDMSLEEIKQRQFNFDDLLLLCEKAS